MAEVAAYLAIGAAVGFFAGLLGIGGGTIIVSSLALMFAARAFPPEFVMHFAIGTSLAAIIAGSWSSFRAHHVHGAVDWAVVKAMIPGLLAGVLLGSIFARFVNAATRSDNSPLIWWATAVPSRMCADMAYFAVRSSCFSMAGLPSTITWSPGLSEVSGGGLNSIRPRAC